jgi:hypothetical protein
MMYVLYCITHNFKHQEYRKNIIILSFYLSLFDNFMLKLTSKSQSQVSMTELILIVIYVRVKQLQMIQLSAYVASDDKSLHSFNQNFPSEK